MSIFKQDKPAGWAETQHFQEKYREDLSNLRGDLETPEAKRIRTWGKDPIEVKIKEEEKRKARLEKQSIGRGSKITKSFKKTTGKLKPKKLEKTHLSKELKKIRGNIY